LRTLGSQRPVTHHPQDKSPADRRKQGAADKHGPPAEATRKPGQGRGGQQIAGVAQGHLQSDQGGEGLGGKPGGVDLQGAHQNTGGSDPDEDSSRQSQAVIRRAGKQQRPRSGDETQHPDDPPAFEAVQQWPQGQLRQCKGVKQSRRQTAQLRGAQSEIDPQLLGDNGG
jgi:hypothetical protein